jgi:phospholipid/cholesterol/gamma-HCH transport system permease protein
MNGYQQSNSNQNSSNQQHGNQLSGTCLHDQELNGKVKSPLEALFITPVEHLGEWIIKILEDFGKAWLFLMRTLYHTIKPPYRTFLFINQLFQIGVNSSLVISLIGLFTGAVLAVQAEYTLTKFGATAFTGSAVALSLIRELGPVLTALMVIGRAGSAITAEIGIMKITEQIDALRSMAVDPIKFLMVPRFAAGIIAMPILTALFVVVGIMGGYIVGVTLLGLSSGTFVSEMVTAVTSIDIYSGAIKSVVFGFLFGWISCYKGYRSGYGAVGVNKATTQSVVTASVSILIVDYFLTSILTRVFMD